MTGASNKIRPKNKFFKLVKNDFLASSRLISLCYVALAIVLLIGVVTRKLIDAGSLTGEALEKVSKIFGISIAVSLIGVFVIIIATVFFVVYDFFKSLYSPQGYLSFTLPVSSNQLLGSKILVYGGWLVLSFAALFFVYFYWGKFAMTEYGEEISMVETFAGVMGLGLSLNQLIAQVVIIAVGVAVYIISLVFLVYFAITLSHVGKLQKYSIILSVILFFIAASLFFNITAKSSELVNFSVIFVPETKRIAFDILKDGEAFKENLVAVCITDIITSILLDVGIFFGTSYIMHKKVNIK